jgi:hypothetical protein
MLTKRARRVILKLLRLSLYYRVRAMTTKPGIKKPEIKRPAKAAAKKAAASTAPVGSHQAVAKRTVPISRTVDPSRLNAVTIKALRDAKVGKNLTRYVDEDDLFRKLGIKIGEAQGHEDQKA